MDWHSSVFRKHTHGDRSLLYRSSTRRPRLHLQEKGEVRGVYAWNWKIFINFWMTKKTTHRKHLFLTLSPRLCAARWPSMVLYQTTASFYLEDQTSYLSPSPSVSIRIYICPPPTVSFIQLLPRQLLYIYIRVWGFFREICTVALGKRLWLFSNFVHSKTNVNKCLLPLECNMYFFCGRAGLSDSSLVKNSNLIIL